MLRPIDDTDDDDDDDDDGGKDTLNRSGAGGYRWGQRVQIGKEERSELTN